MDLYLLIAALTLLSLLVWLLTTYMPRLSLPARWSRALPVLAVVFLVLLYVLTRIFHFPKGL